MAHASAQVPVSVLRERLNYDAQSGELTWRIQPTRNVRIGKVAGCRNGSGYIHTTITFERCQHWLLAHRIAWAITHGEWPPPGMEVDHINGCRADNRLSNLRLVSPAQNRLNAKTSRSSRSGVKGVCWDASYGRWLATVTRHGKTHYVGRFDNLRDAAQAVRAAREVLHGAYANHG